MTKDQFLQKVPHIIQHRSWGIAKIEILADEAKKKGVCYRLTSKKTATCGTYGRTWTEVYEKLIDYLKAHGLYNK
jgi:hypothetical protein